MPVVCASCGGDAGIASAERSNVEPSLPPDPEQLARDRRLRLLNIPHGFEGATLDSFEATGTLLRRKHVLALRYLDVFHDLPVVARLIVLQGGAGTGKTHLCVAIGRELAVEQNVGARYASFPDVVRELRAGDMANVEPADREIAVLDRYRTVDLLILDDVNVDAVEGLGHCASHLSDIVTARYEADRPTIIATRDPIGHGSLISDDLAAAIVVNKALWWFGLRAYARRDA